MTKLVNAIMPWNQTGYGHASIGYLQCLAEMQKEGKIDLNFIPIGPVAENDPELSQPEYKELLNYRNKVINWSGINLSFWHLSHSKDLFPPEAQNRYMMSTFEIDCLNQLEIEAIASATKVAFACNFNIDVAKNESNNVYSKPIPHLPYDKVPKYEPSIDWLEDHFGLKIDKDSITLCTIGKFEARKGHYEILSALDLITVPFLLVAYWYNPFIPNRFPFAELVARNYKPVPSSKTNCRIYKKNNITLILPNPALTRTELYDSAAHCSGYLCTSKAEGFNLPLFDLYMAGIPCISTLNTAMRDYLLANQFQHIIGGPAEVATDGIFFHGTGKWMSLDPFEIIKAISKFKDSYPKANLGQVSYLNHKQSVKHLLKSFIDL